MWNFSKTNKNLDRPKFSLISLTAELILKDKIHKKIQMR